MLSLMSGGGREHKRVHLRERFAKREVTVLGSYTSNNDVLILLSSGKSQRADVRGFTLSIMRVMRDSGNELGYVEHF